MIWEIQIIYLGRWKIEGIKEIIIKECKHKSNDYLCFNEYPMAILFIYENLLDSFTGCIKILADEEIFSICSSDIEKIIKDGYPEHII